MAGLVYVKPGHPHEKAKLLLHVKKINHDLMQPHFLFVLEGGP